MSWERARKALVSRERSVDYPDNTGLWREFYGLGWVFVCFPWRVFNK